MNAENRSRITETDGAKILWLDWLTENPDRTPRNSNILTREKKFWLIDHGAALGFQYSLQNLTEDSPARSWVCASGHIFYDARHLLTRVHSELAPFCSYDEFLTLSWEVPAEFIRIAGAEITYDKTTRRRELLAAWLWKRLKSFNPAGI